MGVETQKFIRKPLYVDAVRVNANNFDDLVAWCNGEVQTDEQPGSGTTKKYIKVRVHNPKNPRQTKAFFGDWLLYTERGYKVYTNRAFRQAFDEVENTEEPTEPETPGDQPEPHGPHEPRLLTETGADGKMKHEPPVGDLPPQPRRVGANVEIRDDRAKEVMEETLDQAQEKPAMKEAREQIEADGGTLEVATPEGIAQAARENEQARAAAELAEKSVSKMVRQDEEDLESDPANGGETVDEIIESHPEGVHAGMSEAAGETPIAPPLTPPNPAEGKRVLSEKEQQVLGPHEVRKLISSGDVVLAQDLAAEQA